MMDTAVLIFRLLLGAILFAHAAQKLFGWFGGNGVKKQATIFESLGLKPGVPMVVMAGTMELLAATLLVLGLATPLAALIGSGTMLVAGLTMHLNSGRFWNSAGGGEYPYVLAAAMAAVGIGGAGQHALDRFLATEWPPLTPWLEPSWIHALAIPALALVSALPFALLLRRGRH
jgi:putative oxidoreductase